MKKSTAKNYDYYYVRLIKCLPEGYDPSILSPEDFEKAIPAITTRGTYIYALMSKYKIEDLRYGQELRDYAKRLRIQHREEAPYRMNKNMPTLDEIKNVYYENEDPERPITAQKAIIAFYFYPFIDPEKYQPIRNEIFKLILGKEQAGKNTYSLSGRIVINDTKATSSVDKIVIKLPEAVNKYFKHYVKVNKINTGERLFDGATSDTISGYLRRFSKSIVGKSITSTDLRKAFHHIFFKEEHKAMGEGEKKLTKVCKNMGHSVNTATTFYSKYGVN